MSNEFRDKLLTVGVISKRTKPRVREGKHHPDSGRRFKETTTEAGTVTEHSAPGAAPGVSDRQDVVVRPETINMKFGVDR